MRILADLKNDAEAGYLQIMENNSQSQAWDKKRKEIYNRYVKDEIGSKRLKDIKPLHIGRIISKMRDKGLSANTQNKVLVILRPMFEFAVKKQAHKRKPSFRNSHKAKRYQKDSYKRTGKTKTDIYCYYGPICRRPLLQSLFSFCS